MKPKSKILIIAGSDSSGGAGIQADIKTVSSLGSYAMTAVTSITSQNTTGVVSIFPVLPKEISKQAVLMKTIDDLNKRYGQNTLQWAACGIDKKWEMSRQYLSSSSTTQLSEIPLVRA